jgi:hypothetical protein
MGRKIHALPLFPAHAAEAASDETSYAAFLAWLAANAGVVACEVRRLAEDGGQAIPGLASHASADSVDPAHPADSGRLRDSADTMNRMDSADAGSHADAIQPDDPAGAMRRENTAHADDSICSVDSLEGLVSVVAALADANPAEERRAAAILAAERGTAARAHGCHASEILAEHYLLREAVWRWAQRVVEPAPRAEAVMARLEPAVILSAAAALQGHRRPELEAEGRWSQALADILDGIASPDDPSAAHTAPDAEVAIPTSSDSVDVQPPATTSRESVDARPASPDAESPTDSLDAWPSTHRPADRADAHAIAASADADASRADPPSHPDDAQRAEDAGRPSISRGTTPLGVRTGSAEARTEPPAL